MARTPRLTPRRIRAIRESLGLTQEEAGKLLGGGPRAFTDYEVGSVKPRTATINLLRVLEIYPDALGVLREGDLHAAISWVPAPFEVESDDIASLGPSAFPSLLRRLLSAEARKYGLPQDGISVASRIHVSDGGEDGRISWLGDPERTLFLPSRLCQFQLKSGKVGSAAAGNDVLTSGGEVQPMVRSVLEQGGHYIMLSAQPYVQQEVEARQHAICDALGKAGLSVPDDRICFREADQIAMWANTHQPVALWVREEVGLGTPGGFTSWNLWKGRSEHSVPWVEDPRLTDLQRVFRSQIGEPGAVLRVVGMSGIGKSRLCLEAVKRVGDDEMAGRSLRDFVMYAVQSEVGAEAILPVVQELAVSGERGIVVVDDCDARGHAILAGMVSRPGSCLSLISIDNEIPSHTDANTVKIDEAPAFVVKSIVDHVAATLHDLDRHRLANLSQGFPEIAIRIAKESDTGRHLTYPADDDLIEDFICGRRPADRALLLQAAQLLAVFGPVRVDDGQESHVATVQTVASAPTAKEYLTRIADLGRQITYDDLFTAVQRLTQRGVLKRRGRLGTIQPRPIAVRLAERQWIEWDGSKWDRVLSGDIGPDLSVLAARRLAELNASEVANNVVVHVLRESGRFAQIDLPGRAEILSALAQVNADVVAEFIGRSLDRTGDLRQLGDDVRRPLIRALRTIAFPSSTFLVGVRLMLRLVVTDNAIETWGTSHRFFEELFFLDHGGTEADGHTRLLFLDEAADTNDHVQLEHVVAALVAGCSLGESSRTFGPEIQGSRKVLRPWYPGSKAERAEYVVGCVNRLAGLAVRGQDIGAKARSDLGGLIASLVYNGFIQAVEDAIQRVVGSDFSWSLALRQLKAVLEHDSELIDDKTSGRVQVLIDKLEPTSLPERVRTFVTEPPMPGFMETESSISAQIERHRAIVQALARELLEEAQTLGKLLPDLSSGRQSMADELGVELARSASSPLEWLEPIVQAVVNVPATKRNYDLLSGFVAGLPAPFYDEAEAFKAKAVGSSDLAPAFPKICRRAGLCPKDITRAVDALDQGTLSPWDLHHWAFTWVLDKVPPATVARLLDTMLDHSAPSFALAVTILGRILLDDGKSPQGTGPYIFEFAGFRPQVLKMAQNAGRWNRADYSPGPELAASGFTPSVAEHHFKEIVLRTLDGGPEDPDAQEMALALAEALVQEDQDDWINPSFIKMSPVLTRLLRVFSEVAWQLIGRRIVADARFATRMKYALGRPTSLATDVRPPLLDLPQETLFEWCTDNPDGAPAFVAQSVPILSTESGDAGDSILHPMVSWLLDEFGERGDVQEALASNIRFGSSASYYSRYTEALERLRTHPKSGVREWAETMRHQIARWIAYETTRHEERQAGSWLG